MSKIRQARSAVRYASARTGVDFEKWLTWGAIGVGGFFLYKIYSAFAGGADKAADAVANAYVDLTHDPIQVIGHVVLPNGQKVPLQQIRPASDFTFTWGTVKYRLTKRRPDNDYDAVRA